MHRCENNITVDLQETEWDGVHLIHLEQDRVAVSGSCDHSIEPLCYTKKYTRKFLISVATVNFLRRGSVPGGKL